MSFFMCDGFHSMEIILKGQKPELKTKQQRLWTHQKVLRLDVSVYDAEAMQVPEGIGQVVHHGTAISLCVLGWRSNCIKEISTL